MWRASWNDLAVPARRWAGPAGNTSGFTLAELLLVTALIGLLLVLALPAGATWLQRQRLANAAETVLNDLYLARSEALHGARNVIFRYLQTASGSCYVIHSGSPNGCSCDVSGPPSCLAGAYPLKQAQWPRRQGYPTLLSNAPTMLFSGRQGTASMAATLQVSIEGVGEVRHVVSITGRIRSCSGDQGFKRWLPCAGAAS